MWITKYTTKNDQVRYKFSERYTDPLTNKSKIVSISLNKNNAQSRKEALIRLNDKIQKKIRESSTINIDSLTFIAALDEWFEHYKNTAGVKASTIYNKKSSIKTIKKVIDQDILIKKMTTRYLQEIFNEWSKSKKRSHSTLKNLRSVINKVFLYVQLQYGLDDLRAIQNVELPNKQKSRSEILAIRNNYLEDEEVTELINILEEMQNEGGYGRYLRNVMVLRYAVEFQTLNGMRIGELIAIQNKDVDYENKKLDINGTYVRASYNTTGDRGYKDTTKTESSYRTIDLTDRSIEILKKLELENRKSIQWDDNFNDNDYIFTNTVGNPLDTMYIGRVLKKVVERSSITKKVTTHTFRHTHISRLAQMNVNLRAIQSRVGHSDSNTTLMIYTHVTEAMSKEMINKLNLIGY